jgi:hypothetical protein
LRAVWCAVWCDVAYGGCCVRRAVCPRWICPAVGIRAGCVALGPPLCMPRSIVGTAVRYALRAMLRPPPLSLAEVPGWDLQYATSAWTPCSQWYVEGVSSRGLRGQLIASRASFRPRALWLIDLFATPPRACVRVCVCATAFQWLRVGYGGPRWEQVWSGRASPKCSLPEHHLCPTCCCWGVRCIRHPTFDNGEVHRGVRHVWWLRTYRTACVRGVRCHNAFQDRLRCVGVTSFGVSSSPPPAYRFRSPVSCRLTM